MTASVRLCGAWILGVAIACAFVGCGEPVPPSGPTQPIGQRIQEYLDDLAKRGELDSGIIWLDEALTEYAVEHPTEAAELRADYQKLSALRDSSAIKAKAKEMSAKVKL